MTQRTAAEADTDRMLAAHAYFLTRTIVIVELGPLELHVDMIEGDALWLLAATGRRLSRARWMRA